MGYGLKIWYFFFLILLNYNAYSSAANPNNLEIFQNNTYKDQAILELKKADPNNLKIDQSNTNKDLAISESNAKDEDITSVPPTPGIQEEGSSKNTEQHFFNEDPSIELQRWQKERIKEYEDLEEEIAISIIDRLVKNNDKAREDAQNLVHLLGDIYGDYLAGQAFPQDIFNVFKLFKVFQNASNDPEREYYKDNLVSVIEKLRKDDSVNPKFLNILQKISPNPNIQLPREKNVVLELCMGYFEKINGMWASVIQDK